MLTTLICGNSFRCLFILQFLGPEVILIIIFASLVCVHFLSHTQASADHILHHVLFNSSLSAQDAFLAPLLQPSAARRPQVLSAAAVELHDGDKMPFLPPALDWLLREDSARRDFTCFGVPLALEVAFPVQSAFNAPVRRLSVRCSVPRLFLSVAEALVRLVVRRKSVSCEGLKQDLLLLQALTRSGANVAGSGDVLEEFQELLNINALLGGLRCV